MDGTIICGIWEELLQKLSRSQERNTGASSAVLQGGEKREVGEGEERGKAFSLVNFIIYTKRLAKVFSPLNRQLRKLFWRGS